VRTNAYSAIRRFDMSCSPKNTQPPRSRNLRADVAMIGVEHDAATSRIEVEHAGRQVWQQVADVSLFHVIRISDRDVQT
jgi:hypothetical protein